MSKEDLFDTFPQEHAHVIRRLLVDIPSDLNCSIQRAPRLHLLWITLEGIVEEIYDALKTAITSEREKETNCSETIFVNDLVKSDKGYALRFRRVLMDCKAPSGYSSVPTFQIPQHSN